MNTADRLDALNSVSLTNSFAGLVTELNRTANGRAVVSADAHDVTFYAQLKTLGLLQVSKVRKTSKKWSKIWSAGLPANEVTVTLTAQGRAVYQRFCAQSI